MTPPRMRRAAAFVALPIAAALALTACSPSGSTASGSGEADTTLQIGELSSPASLDFTMTGGAAIPQALLYNVYEGLVKLDDEGEIQPLLAESWTMSDDGTVYDFTLQQGVTFSNGSPFTAETVKFSLERAATEWTANSPAYLSPISSIEVVSDTEVRITLNAPSNGWLYNMTGPIGTMFSPDGIDALATDPVGTGPYDVTDFQTGTSLELTRRDDYWGDEPFMSEVSFTYFGDATAQTNALLSGDIDLIATVSQYQTVEQLEADDSLTVQVGDSTGELTLSMNNAAAPFDDVRVRQAVMYAVDRQAILDTVNFGYGTLIGSMVAPTEPWYDESLVDLYPYDPERAEELLAEAGVEDLTITLDVPSARPAWADAAQIVADQLGQVGITVNLETLEFPAVWLEQVMTNHDYEMTIISHAEPRDASAFAAPTYYPGYDDPETMALFAEADAAPDQDTYVELMREATTKMAEDAVADWLYENPTIRAFSNDISGVNENAISLAFDLTNITR